MGKRAKVMLAVAAVALVTVILWQVAQPRDPEPVYKGKPLSEWLINYVIDEDTQGADTAVRQAGTNALPLLLRMLRAKDSPVKARLIYLAEKQSAIKTKFSHASDRNEGAAFAFKELGSNAQSAVPQLIEIANANISPASRYYAINSLGCIGPSAKEAVPVLLQAATNADPGVRSFAITALGQIHADPTQTVPVLINALHDPAKTVPIFAAMALQRFGPDAKLAVPALVGFLSSLNTPKDLSSREYALEVYEETPEYGISDDFDLIKGGAQTFKWKVEGNKWYHNGKLSNGLTIEEVWERVEKK